MFRWAFLVPRLLVVLCFCLWLRFGLDPLLSRIVSTGGQMATGARIDLESLTSSLPHGRLHVGGVQVADPHSPMQNCVQFDEAWLKMDTWALLDRHWVVDQGAITGLKFDTNRETSGELPASKKKNVAKGPGLSSQVVEGMGDVAEDWLDDLSDRFLTDLEEEFHSVRLARELARRWPAEYRHMTDRVDAWKARVEQVRQLAAGIREDPWKHLTNIESGLREVDTVRSEAHQFRLDMQRIHDQFLADRKAIRDASRHDTHALREKLHIRDLHGEQLSDYLLGPELVDQVTQLTRWLDRGQDAYKLVGQRPQINHEGRRGKSIDFGTTPRPPDLLFRTLLLSGTSQVNGNDVEFTGRFEGLTHQPLRYRKPMTYQLSTTGAIATQIQGTVDYREATPRHHLVVSCPAIQQPPRTLGDAERFAVTCSSGPAQVWLELTLVGNEVSGEVRWRQDDLVVDPIVSDRFGGERLQRGVARAVREVDRIHARVRLSGTLTKPHCRLRSSLGPQIARGMNAAVRQELQGLATELSARADAAVAEYLEEVDTTLQMQHAELLSRLREHEDRIEQYKQQLASQLRQPVEQLRQPFSASALRKAVARLRTGDNSQGHR